MDSQDRPEAKVPAVSQRVTARPALIDPAMFGKPISADAPGSSVNPLRLVFRALSRHWWQILLLWMLGTGGLCYLIWVKVKPVYESVSLLRVEPSKSDIFNVNAHGGETFGPFLETQVNLVLSTNVLSTVVNEPSIGALPSVRGAEDAEVELRKMLTVHAIPNSYLLEVRATTPSATDSAKIVNTVVEFYLKAAGEWSGAATVAQIKSLETYQNELESMATEKRNSLLALASKADVDLQFNEQSSSNQPGGNLPVPTRNKVSVEDYRRWSQQLAETTIALGEAEVVLKLREAEATNHQQGQRASQEIERLFKAEPDVVPLINQIETARRHYDETVRLTRSDSDPSRVDARKKLNHLIDRYDQLLDERREELAARFAQAGKDDTGHSLRDAQERVQVLKTKRDDYQKMLGKIEVANRQESSNMVQMALVREELSSVQQMREAVNKRLEQLRFEQRGETRISQVSPGRVNSSPAKDTRRLLIGLTPILLLALVSGFFVFMEFKIGRVSDLDDLSKQVHVEVFALPPLPGPRLEPGQRGAREREGRLQEFLQSLDHLRVALCDESGAGDSGRCIMITSATASEGKTTLAAQLSACCAKAGISTLLIDADMRRATLSRMLNEEKTAGLSDVLQGNLSADAAAVPIPDAGFHLLPAGSPGRDPSWLLKGQRFGQIMTRYRQLFDLIIIDTPPILPVPDALTMGRWTDGVVIATRFDVSRLPLVDKARRRISSAGIPLLKTVVNGVRTSRFYYGYGGGGYGYGYGYGHGYGYGYGHGYGYGGRERGRVAPPESSPTA